MKLEGAPRSRANGIDRSQAQAASTATPHRTAENRRVAPTPTIAPVIVCVGLTGTPSEEARKRVAAPLVSAQKPPIGRRSVIRMPIVLMIRQPPDSAPAAMVTYEINRTQYGT